MLEPITDVEAFVRTRAAWHTLAERVLAPARHAATGHIGLVPAPGGFATPRFTDRTIAVEGSDLVVVDAAGTTRRRTVTTLGDAAALAGVAPDADTGVYTATTPADPDTPLTVDPAAAIALAAWFAFGAGVLGAWSTSHTDEGPAAVQLWPEHFDLGTDLGPDDDRRANYGASPGDADHPLPYLYVGPWVTNDDPFWNAGSYARLPYGALCGRDDPESVAADFFGRGRAAAGAKS